MPFHDPYGTLKGCFVFAVQIVPQETDSNGVVGVLKNGVILWMSHRFYAGCGGKIYAALDLNGDSTVDIVSLWGIGFRCEYDDMWIHSWNGIEGATINANNGRSSSIKALGFRFVPVEGRNVIDIIGQEGQYDAVERAYMEDSVATFRWNGSKFQLMK